MLPFTKIFVSFITHSARQQPLIGAFGAVGVVGCAFLHLVRTSLGNTVTLQQSTNGSFDDGIDPCRQSGGGRAAKA